MANQIQFNNKKLPMLDTRRRRVEKVSIKLSKLNFKENSFLYLSVSLLENKI